MRAEPNKTNLERKDELDEIKMSPERKLYVHFLDYNL